MTIPLSTSNLIKCLINRLTIIKELNSSATLSPTSAQAQQIRYNIASNVSSSDDPVRDASHVSDAEDIQKDPNFILFSKRYSELETCLERLSESSDEIIIQDFENAMCHYAAYVSECMSGGYSPNSDKILKVFAEGHKATLKECYKTLNILEDTNRFSSLKHGNKLWLHVFFLGKDLALKYIRPSTLRNILFTTAQEVDLKEKDLQQRKFDIFRSVVTSKDINVKRHVRILLEQENLEKFISQFDEEKQKEIQKLAAMRKPG